ncbi:zinc transport system substrate-binding protein [Carnobacterium alterfunditum]|uniref:Zinc transport system substrate-binding protein n=1 Tax=Carnobacterium alterfunditum TaxID=28230 RepID=A0A1N6F0W5_9LACT|nr:metal ABC transporter substrate-binding protein [Carnobacterium alterfunditum]SIN88910.1 zinc transport system substrate-binding protein [Carnobacterium alterfunditum]
MKKVNTVKLLVSLFGSTALLVACGTESSQSGSTSEVESSESNNEKLQIVTTFYPMYDFTKNVVQDTADVSLLIPAGTEPHDFEPSAKMVADIENADVFIYNSDDMETWVPSVLENIKDSETVIVNASEGIDFIHNEELEEHDHEEDHEEYHVHAIDPHVWLDPVLAQTEVLTIQAGLIEADPDNVDLYEANAEVYIQKLDNLNQEFEKAFEGAENRTFVTQHAAFAYLAQQYDLTQIAISGLSPELEPSPAKLAELSVFAKENNVNHIYFEDNASSKIAETLATEVGVELAVLSPIEGITQEDQDLGIDYIQLMKNNLESLKKSIN